ncbi:AAA domain-containing protein [Aphelenchoides bicaudatus]|nr:AAA domain-containing protein [Aphelenchoides bicaudatus]
MMNVNMDKVAQIQTAMDEKMLYVTQFKPTSKPPPGFVKSTAPNQPKSTANETARFDKKIDHITRYGGKRAQQLSLCLRSYPRIHVLIVRYLKAYENMYAMSTKSMAFYDMAAYDNLDVFQKYILKPSSFSSDACLLEYIPGRVRFRENREIHPDLVRRSCKRHAHPTHHSLPILSNSSRILYVMPERNCIAALNRYLIMAAATLAPIFGGPQIVKKEKKSARQNVPWVEKYRPSRVDEVAYQTEVVSALKNCLDGVDLPHMLFYGPPGTGKTTSAVAICRQLFRGQECFDERVLELNASDERGIDVVRNRIKTFAQNMVRTTVNKKCAASVKVVILDEADAMTTTAQMALRRIMETESKTTRFFIICNYVSRIIAPLASRCVKFRFKPLPADIQLERLLYIRDEEKLSVNTDALQKLVELSDGDLRKSITRLQSLSLGCNSINASTVVEMCGQVDETIILRFIEACRKSSLRAGEKEVDEVICSGYSSLQFLRQLAPHIIHDSNLNGVQKAKLLQTIAETEERLLDGASTLIQLCNTAAIMHKIYHDSLINSQNAEIVLSLGKDVELQVAPEQRTKI